ncbi:hypothetical protein Baya_9311 [Bagarius yarrelli]|uniref:Uncharacterized protein n=1 Tax=Bagarius yarrelli TaxID=175774 RepID=A0A556U618_BAGYA|nr:hypothetical protein Baya_9311 [Bagarius yarrelli]
MPALLSKQCCVTGQEPAERFRAQVEACSGALITSDGFDGRQKAAVCEHCGESERSQNDVPPARCFSHLLVLLQVHTEPLQRSPFHRANFILQTRYETD